MVRNVIDCAPRAGRQHIAVLPRVVRQLRVAVHQQQPADADVLLGPKPDVDQLAARQLLELPRKQVQCVSNTSNSRLPTFQLFSPRFMFRIVSATFVQVG